MSDFLNKYPYTDFHELNLDWVIERVKKLTEDWLATQQEWNDTEEQWQQLHDYVMNYFDNLDVSQEINDKIDAMVSDGTFLDIIRSTVEAQTITTTTSWLNTHITQPTTPVVDTSLTIAGAAADAKTVGDRFTSNEKTDNEISAQLDWHASEYIADDLRIRPSNSYQYSHPIVLYPSDQINVFTIGYQNTICIIAECDDIGTPTQALVLSDNTEKWYSYTNNTGSAIKILVTVNINGRTPLVAVKGVGVGTLSDTVEHDNYIINQITTVKELKPSNDILTRYTQQGYINQGSGGAFTPLSGYYVYYFTVPVDSYFWLDTVPVGEFKTMAVYENTVFTDMILYASRTQGTLPTVLSKLYVKQGNVIAICTETDKTFTAYNTGYNEIILPEAANKEMITIKPIDSTHFNIFIQSLDDDHSYHYNFHRVQTIKTIGSFTLLTMDAWDVNILNEDNTRIMQGNFNFIHSLNEPAGHTGYIGAGDGCAVIDWCMFFADGKPFVPGTDVNIIKCTEFRCVQKIKHYLSDGTSIIDTTPVIDALGNPTIESFNTMDFTINCNGTKCRNKMLINIDGIKYSECHAGMLTGYYPYFDNVILLNKETTWNKVEDNGGTPTVVLEGDSTINLSQDMYNRADSAILYGDHIIATMTMKKIITGDKNQINVRCWLPPNQDNRVKIYFMPVVTTKSDENIADGEPVDTFNTGDVIDVEYEKTIKYYV